MSRRAPAIILLEEEKKRLNALIRGQKTEQRYVLRAQIVLEASKGLENKQIAMKLHTNKMTITKWRSGFFKKIMEGLKDEQRPGKPVTYGMKDRAKIIEMVCNPPSNLTRWSVRDLARALKKEGVSISKSQLNEILNELDLKPHQFRMRLRSKDPDFERKEVGLVGLYLNPPENSLVISVDEKTQLQAREPINPTISMSKGHPVRQDPTYKRHGHISLLAALFCSQG